MTSMTSPSSIFRRHSPQKRQSSNEDAERKQIEDLRDAALDRSAFSSSSAKANLDVRSIATNR
jgi:hypothetical protein